MANAQATIEAKYRQQLSALHANISRVIHGKSAVIEKVIVGLLAEGHILLDDVPGVGKSTLARSLDLSFRRIQFTPDLLPSDITGMTVYNTQRNEFEFKPGPLFAHVILADEINRTTPRTQSALLEAMNEGQVTVDGHTYRLPRPFLILATENPIEFAGTYPLPESQLDRFALRLRMDYPEREAERAMVRSRQTQNPLDALAPVLGGGDILALIEAARKITVSDDVLDYLQAIILATREHPALQLGASPRATLCLIRLSQALAMVRGRAYV
ncbi:MAG: AAA family ATPase, partial [Planctomycetota bacterium]|nr:AAA family ATPase [Planctomycetota bacterium]